MTPRDAFQLTFDLAENFLSRVVSLRLAIETCISRGIPLTPQWQEVLVHGIEPHQLIDYAVELKRAEQVIQQSINQVKTALAEARLSDAIIFTKQWDLTFDRVLEPVLSEGPRQSKALPQASDALRPGIDAINHALDMRYETIGQITPQQAAFEQLLRSSENPWRR